MNLLLLVVSLLSLGRRDCFDTGFVNVGDLKLVQAPPTLVIDQLEYRIQGTLTNTSPVWQSVQVTGWYLMTMIDPRTGETISNWQAGGGGVFANLAPGESRWVTQTTYFDVPDEMVNTNGAIVFAPSGWWEWGGGHTYIQFDLTESCRVIGL